MLVVTGMTDSWPSRLDLYTPLDTHLKILGHCRLGSCATSKAVKRGMHWSLLIETTENRLGVSLAEILCPCVFHKSCNAYLGRDAASPKRVVRILGL